MGVLWGLDSRHGGRPVRTGSSGVIKMILTRARRKQYNSFFKQILVKIGFS